MMASYLREKALLVGLSPELAATRGRILAKSKNCFNHSCSRCAESGVHGPEITACFSQYAEMTTKDQFFGQHFSKLSMTK